MIVGWWKCNFLVRKRRIVRSVVGECCSSGLWRHCCQKCLRICGSGFCRERKRKMVCTAIVRPYSIRGDIAPKREKLQKSEWFSFLVFEMLSLLAKILDCNDFCVLASKNKREKSLCEGNESHACVSRAYQQRFNFFAVTSVTQGGKRWRKRWRNPVRGKDEKSVFRCCDTLMLSDWTANLLKSIPDVAVIYWNIGV